MLIGRPIATPPNRLSKWSFRCTIRQRNGATRRALSAVCYAMTDRVYGSTAFGIADRMR
jgi:hypothetical protein